MGNQEILNALARAKVEFQKRAIMAAMEIPPQSIRRTTASEYAREANMTDYNEGSI